MDTDLDNDLDLSALQDDPLPVDPGPLPVDPDAMTEDELQERGKEALWLSDEMEPPQNVAYSLRRIDGALGEIMEALQESTTAQERIATALEKALASFAK